MKGIVCPRCREFHLFEKDKHSENYKAVLPCITVDGRLHKELAFVSPEYFNAPWYEQSRARNPFENTPQGGKDE